MTMQAAVRPPRLKIVPCIVCRADLFQGETRCHECGSDNARRVRFCRECGGGLRLDLSLSPGLVVASCLGAVLGIAAALWGLLGAATVPAGMAVLAVHAVLSPRLRCRRCDAVALSDWMCREERSSTIVKALTACGAGVALGLVAFAAL